jgi:27-O-demethylrifamycin SV methyltransferase
MSVKEHYDNVTDVWLYIMGDNLHYGLFKPENISLKDATIKLIDHLSALSIIDANSHILDVGCGIGEPAFHLHEKFNCKLTGISISPRGIEIAKERCEKKGYSQYINFLVADGTKKNFPDNHFDHVWVMESSHLIKNKKQLFEENYRVLKDGGSMLLCDLMLMKELTVVDLYKYRKEIEILERTFGKAKMEPIHFYKEKAIESKFSEVEVINISKETQLTLKKWEENISLNKKDILKFFRTDKVDEFINACEITNDFFDKGMFGYGMLKCTKEN